MTRAVACSVLLRGLGRKVRWEFGDAAGLVVDEHGQVEIADHGHRAGARLDGGEPFGVVGALRRLFRGPDVDAAAGTIFADDIVLSDKLFIPALARHAGARVGDDLLPRPAGRIFEFDDFHDHRSVSLSF